MVNAVQRVLKTNGIAFISTTYKKWYGWYFKNNGKWVLDPTHLREYSDDKQLFDLIDLNKFEILENKKTLLAFPVVDLFLRLFKIYNRQIHQHKIVSLLKYISIPIPGYYNWEIVIKKK